MGKLIEYGVVAGLTVAATLGVQSFMKGETYQDWGITRDTDNTPVLIERSGPDGYTLKLSGDDYLDVVLEPGERDISGIKNRVERDLFVANCNTDTPKQITSPGGADLLSIRIPQDPVSHVSRTRLCMISLAPPPTVG